MAVLAGLLAMGAHAGETAQKPYDIDAMLRTEGVGSGWLAEAGRLAVITRQRPHEESGFFQFHSESLFARHGGGEIWIADLSAGTAARPVLSDPKSDYRGIDLSPDGSKLLYVRTLPDRASLGVLDLRAGTHREFASALDNCCNPFWAGEQVVFGAGDPAQQQMNFPARMKEAWDRRLEGEQTTASVIGSGKFWTGRTANVRLIVADPGSGKERVVAEEPLFNVVGTPDGKHIAIVARPDAPLPQNSLRQSFRLPHSPTPLTIMEVSTGKTWKPCGDCDALPSSLAWSPDGRKLAFAARSHGQMWADARIRSFDVIRRKELRLEPALTTVNMGREAWFDKLDVRLSWAGDELLIGSNQAVVDERSPCKNAWWVASGKNAGTNLMQNWCDGSAKPLAITGDALVVSKAEQLWLAAPGKPLRMIATSAAGGSWKTVDASQRTGDFPLASIVYGRSEGQVQALSPRTGNQWTLQISPDGKLLDLSEGRALSMDSEGEASVVEIHAAGSGKELLRVNDFLNDYVTGAAYPVTHDNPFGGSILTSYVVMPPGWSKGDGPLPALVEIYPNEGPGGTAHRARTRIGDLGFAGNNQLLLPAQGYALFLANVPMKADIPREPMSKLAEHVDIAVDAAIAAGYIEGSRLALEGTSFGAYSTVATLTQTTRYRAAIARVGKYDLVSAYLTPSIARRFSADRIYSQPPAQGLTETGQTGLGATPWSNRETFIRNSPIFYLDRITTPVLIVHGDLDHATSIGQADELFIGLSRLDKDVLYVRYWGEGHGFNSPANLRDLWERKFQWLDRHIGPPWDVVKRSD